MKKIVSVLSMFVLLTLLGLTAPDARADCPFCRPEMGPGYQNPHAAGYDYGYDAGTWDRGQNIYREQAGFPQWGQGSYNSAYFLNQQPWLRWNEGHFQGYSRNSFGYGFNSGYNRGYGNRNLHDRGYNYPGYYGR